MSKRPGTSSFPIGGAPPSIWEKLIIYLADVAPEKGWEFNPSALYYLIRRIERRRKFPLVYQIAGLLLVLWFLVPPLIVLIGLVGYLVVWSSVTTRSIATSIVSSSFYNDLRCTGIGLLQMRQDILLYIWVAQAPAIILLTTFMVVASIIDPGVLATILQHCVQGFIIVWFYISSTNHAVLRGFQKGFYEVPVSRDEPTDFWGEIRALLPSFGVLVALLLFIPIFRLFHVWDRPLLTLLVLVVYMKVLVILFFLYRKKTGHQPMDSYEATGGLPPDVFAALKFDEHIAHMEEYLSSR